MSLKIICAEFGQVQRLNSEGGDLIVFDIIILWRGFSFRPRRASPGQYISAQQRQSSGKKTSNGFSLFVSKRNRDRQLEVYLTRRRKVDVIRYPGMYQLAESEVL